MFTNKILLSSLLISVSMPSILWAQNANAKSEVIVTATRPSLPSEAQVSKDDLNNDGARDAAALIEGVTGAAIIRNGSQTGMVQLRGLSQERVKIVVDGTEISPACPNHMDPPLHYVMPNQISQLSVVAGITTVSMGGDSIAGTVVVNTSGPQLSLSSAPEISGSALAKYYGANDGYEAALSLNLGLESAGFRLSATKQFGDDLKYAGGTASLTSYDAEHYQLEGTMNIGKQTLGLALGLQQSRNVGTPALGMDIATDNATNARIGLIGDYDFGKITARAYYNNIDHVMDNYTLRTYTAASSRMRAPARSEDQGLNIQYQTLAVNNNIKVGIETHNTDFNVFGEMLMSGMITDSFVNSKRNRTGVYAELDSNIGKHLRTNIGIRADHIEMSSGQIDHYMMMDAAIRNAFNNADRSKNFDNFDISGSARYHINDNFIIEVAAAQKSRAPTIVEMYIWKPSSTYGQADGRNYLGNLNLNSEISRQISISTNLRFGNFEFKPTLFYNKIDDYIQGVAVSSASDATLKFSNINAELSGAEASFSYEFSQNIILDGNISYVKGENLDTKDNLYRIAPLHGSVSLKYEGEKISGMLEFKFADKQNDVSLYNNELKTKGYSILNLRGRYALNDDFNVTFGVENIFDEFYADHLSGINRVNNAALGGDLAIGARIPSAGRSGYLSLNYNF